MQIEPNQKFKASSSYLHRKIADTDVLISIGENIANFNGYIELNSSASIIWDKLKVECTVNELIQIMVENFNISQEQALKDISSFMEILIDHNMVEEV